MKEKFWKKDWFVALFVVLVFLIFKGGTFVQSLETSVYDMGMRMSSEDSGDQIRVIAIDDESINSIGRWPWSREIHARMIDTLAAAGAKVIAPSILYSEPQVDAGLSWIQELDQVFESSGLAAAGSEPAVQGYRDKLVAAQHALDTDSKLAESIKEAGNVVLPMQFLPGQPVGKPDSELPRFISKYGLSEVNDDLGNGSWAVTAIDATPPLQKIAEASVGIGHLNQVQDLDGGLRKEALVINYYNTGVYMPSQALLIAAKTLNLDVSDISGTLGESIQLSGRTIRTDHESLMKTFYYSTQEGGREPFQVSAAFDLLNGKLSPDNFKDKIVIIGATAFGVGISFVTPVSEAMPPALIMAHNVASILNEHFFVSPSWAGMVELLALLAIAIYLMAVLPKLKAGTAAAISALLLIGLLGTELMLMISSSMWLQLASAATLLFLGHLLITTKRFLVAEAGKTKADTESAASNKDLGLAFQQKGDLDMAFERFRRCPMDESMMEVVYNLALDYERKRQFNKAHSAYQYMAETDPKFRDLETRLNRAKQLEETVMLGGGGGGGAANATMLLDGGGVSKPMLGRYEVEKELGKGAMGVVYLGKDPKINRVVAIKTMALAQEFEGDELTEAKERFFREAETAGRLQHPNIVTIYDAGEEHDLAYIAMEFLPGHDLSAYVTPEKLLPLQLVLGLVFKSAQALDYAHQQNVVHRDIKPANLMYDPEKKTVKITDFGIARITDSSKTKTGMVLGTPSYMSPEQLSGKKVDGRSDLFSLGVMLYQMSTGKLPFSGDSMATLMYKIANEEAPPILEVRPDLATTKPGLAPVIEKALQKDADARYQTGAEMAKDLQKAAKSTA